MSDYGSEDHYVPLVKAAILSIDPRLTIVDISHQIKLSDIAHGGYVLGNSFKKFPIGTVHLIAIDSSNRKANRLIASLIEGHYFISQDTGIFSIISDEKPKEVVVLHDVNVKPMNMAQIAPVIVSLTSGTPLQNIGIPIDNYLTLMKRNPKITKREIVGNIVRIDHYGNLITNINKKDYLEIQRLNENSPITIQVGREIFSQLHDNYDDADPGECFVFFNSDQVIQIGINMGNASQLLGLRLDAPIYINFQG